jgi:RNA polymerase sigma-70 factor (ECF subfamily)
MDSQEGTPSTVTESREPPAEPTGRGGPLVSRSTLEKVRARDRQALATLFEFYFERVYGLAFRLMGEKAAAEDVTQDVFYKVYRAADQLDPERDPGPWLMAITYNVCRDAWRSRGYKLARRSQSLEGTEGLMTLLPSGEPDPEAVTLRRERESQVQKAILDLPEPLRIVVLLRDYRGLSHEEIAEVVGASYDAVRKRYSRALARLARSLKDVLS